MLTLLLHCRTFCRVGRLYIGPPLVQRQQREIMECLCLDADVPYNSAPDWALCADVCCDE